MSSLTVKVARCYYRKALFCPSARPERVNGEHETQPEAHWKRIAGVHEVSPFRTTALAESEGAGGGASANERGATLPPRVYSGAWYAIENLTFLKFGFGANSLMRNVNG